MHELYKAQETISKQQAQVANVQATLRMTPEKLTSVKIFKMKGHTWPDEVRLLVYKYLTLRVSPEAIPELIASTIDATIPWAMESGLTLPTVSTCRSWRAELGVLARSDASLTLAESDGIRCAGTDATPIGGKLEVATFNGRVELEGSTMDLLFGGCCVVPDQTAVGEAGAVKTMFAQRAAELEAVITAYAQRHGAAAARAALPASSNVGMHQMGRGGVIITDGASAAIAGRREISKLITEAVKEKFGDSWATMSEAERDAETKTYGANCMRHLPNTWIAGGEKAELEWVKEAIGASIDELEMSDVEKEKARLTPGVGGLVRAIAKEFGTGEDVYAKGEGEKVFTPWAESEHLEALVVHIERAEKGSRFDIATKATLDADFNFEDKSEGDISDDGSTKESDGNDRESSHESESD